MRTRLIAAGAALLTLTAATLTSAAGAQAATGDATIYLLPPGSSYPDAIASLADGNLWVTMSGSGTFASVSTTGVVTPRPVAGLGSGSSPEGIAQDSTGRIWFVTQTSNTLASMSATATDLVQTPLPLAGSKPTSLALTTDGRKFVVAWGTNSLMWLAPPALPTVYTLMAGSGPRNAAAAPAGATMVTMPDSNTVAKVFADTSVQRFSLPTPGSEPWGVTVAADGTTWFTERSGNRIGRLSPAGALTEFTLPSPNSYPWGIAIAPDGSVWFTEYARATVGRITDAGTVTEYAVPAQPVALTAGADGNMWVTSRTNQVTRVLTGVVPVSSGAPAISAPAGIAVTTGTALTATNGAWKYQPTSYAYQWQRCSANDAGTCADITGSTGSTYTVADADLGGWLRLSVKATNLNGTSAAATSGLQQVGAKPTPPPTPLPPVPAPVSGGASVTLVPGVKATLAAPSRAVRGTAHRYTVTLSSPTPKGTIRLSLVTSTGIEKRVLWSGTTLTTGKKSAYVSKMSRLPRSLTKGTYTLRAVYTPAANQTATYPIATLSRPIRVR